MLNGIIYLILSIEHYALIFREIEWSCLFHICVLPVYIIVESPVDHVSETVHEDRVKTHPQLEEIPQLFDGTFNNQVNERCIILQSIATSDDRSNSNDNLRDGCFEKRK